MTICFQRISISNIILILVGINRTTALIVIFAKFRGFHLEATVLLTIIKGINSHEKNNQEISNNNWFF